MEDAHILLEETMEKAAPALNELVFTRLFSREEIAALVKQRRDYEYKIFSPSKTKDQYLKYLEFELNFLQLVLTRKNMKGKNFSLEHFRLILNHVKSIFARALAKYKTDMSLWKSYIDFAVRFNYLVDHVLETALKRNPLQPDLWILSAKWYFEFSNSSDSARSLLQYLVCVHVNHRFAISIPRCFSPCSKAQQTQCQIVARVFQT